MCHKSYVVSSNKQSDSKHCRLHQTCINTEVKPCTNVCEHAQFSCVFLLRLNIRLPSASANFSGPACMRFMRHMYGHHIGSLQVLVRDDDGHERIAWLQSGEQGSDWLDTAVNLYLERDDYVSQRKTNAPIMKVLTAGARFYHLLQKVEH